MATHRYIPAKSTKINHVVDATGKPIGRLASDIAQLLMGKDRADFAFDQRQPINVEVRNAAGAVLTGRKMAQKVYIRHTTYPGGLKYEKAGEMMIAKPEEVVRKAVLGMLPKNNTRYRTIKRLYFS